jgi:glycosyltransferase involved in cell wall biosynthesis
VRLLFVSNSKHTRRPYLDAATRYRCFHPAEDIAEFGWLADVCTLAEFRLSLVKNYDVFVFHRPTYSRGIQNRVAELKKQGKAVIADYDDLIFDPNHALESPPYLSGAASAKIVKHLCFRNLEALNLFDKITVSTVPLGEAVRALNPMAEIEVIYNGLSKRWIEGARWFREFERKQRKIVYFSGTKSHDHDFKLIEDCLADYVNRYDDLVFEVVGSLDFDKTKFIPEKLRMRPHVDYMVLPSLIKSSWVTIAPLQDNEFNRCKSGLKFFESAAFGVPVIATPIPDMQRFQGSGILFAERPDEWTDALDVLQDPEIYVQTSKSILSYALGHCLSIPQTEKLVCLVGSSGLFSGGALSAVSEKTAPSSDDNALPC